MTDNKKRTSMLMQIALLFVVGVILFGVITSRIMFNTADRIVREHLESSSHLMASNLEEYLEQYPAHKWLLSYWYEHYDELDIEYDVDFTTSVDTKRKCSILRDHNPHFDPDYADIDDVEALPPEDQKLYAEIIYSWMITYIDTMQNDPDVDYLFCFVTDAPYDEEFVLFISAEEGRIRGNEHGQIYPIGKIIVANDGQRQAIENAVAGTPSVSLNDDGRYLDYFYSIGSIGDHEVLLVVTSDIRQFENAVRKETQSLSLISALFQTLLAAACLVMVLLVILLPLRKIMKNIRLYKDTKDSATVIDNLLKVESRNELSMLADDFSDLTREIDDYTARIEAITSERANIQAQLSLASRIQAAMLPNKFPAYPDRKDFDIFATMDPARVVGGDFYDFFMIDDDHLCLIMADVSGKGIPAALFMMAAKITLSHSVKQIGSPAKILEYANESIMAKNPEEMFVTAWLGILDLKTGVMTAANAGHEYPILMNAGGRFELIKDKHGIVVGAMEDAVYSNYEFTMVPGSKLFLYTDGLTEATDSDNNMFGTDRALEVLNSNPEAAPADILINMKSAVADFVKDAEQFDDLTMMCLAYNGPDGQES